jgi:hypothetical protein
MTHNKTDLLEYMPVRARLIVQAAEEVEGIKRSAVAGVLLADMAHADSEIWDASIIIVPHRRLDASTIRGGTTLSQAVISHWFQHPEEYDLKEIDPADFEEGE